MAAVGEVRVSYARQVMINPIRQTRDWLCMQRHYGIYK